MRRFPIFLTLTLVFLLSGHILANPCDPYALDRPRPRMYLKEEIINVQINGSKAFMDANYVLVFEEEFNKSFVIGFPIWTKVNNISLKIDDKRVSWFEGRYLYDPLDSENSDLGSMYCMIIEFKKISPRTMVINLSWDTQVSIEGSDNDTIYRYDYLVGTVRSWNHTIEHALFSFTIMSSLARAIDDEWTMKNEGNATQFTREFVEWIPTHDFMSLSWNYSSPTPLGPDSPSGSDKDLGWIPIAATTIFIIILVIISIVIFYRLINKKQGKNHFKGT